MKKLFAWMVTAAMTAGAGMSVPASAAEVDAAPYCGTDGRPARLWLSRIMGMGRPLRACRIFAAGRIDRLPDSGKCFTVSAAKKGEYRIAVQPKAARIPRMQPTAEKPFRYRACVPCCQKAPDML